MHGCTCEFTCSCQTNVCVDLNAPSSHTHLSYAHDQQVPDQHQQLLAAEWWKKNFLLGSWWLTSVLAEREQSSEDILSTLFTVRPPSILLHFLIGGFFIKAVFTSVANTCVVDFEVSWLSFRVHTRFLAIGLVSADTHSSPHSSGEHVCTCCLLNDRFEVCWLSFPVWVHTRFVGIGLVSADIHSSLSGFDDVSKRNLVSSLL